MALEIEALSTEDRDLALARLADAFAIWRHSGSPFGAARNRLMLAGLIRTLEARMPRGRSHRPLATGHQPQTISG